MVFYRFTLFFVSALVLRTLLCTYTVMGTRSFLAYELFQDANNVLHIQHVPVVCLTCGAPPLLLTNENEVLQVIPLRPH